MEIKAKLGHAPSMITIKYWFKEFQYGYSSVFNKEHPGCPTEVMNEKCVR